jgi:hypothetical protein
MHVAAVDTQSGAVTAAASGVAVRAAEGRVSLLRLSLMGRLLLVAAASALLWGAVLFALR